MAAAGWSEYALGVLHMPRVLKHISKRLCQSPSHTAEAIEQTWVHEVRNLAETGLEGSAWQWSAHPSDVLLSSMSQQRGCRPQFQPPCTTAGKRREDHCAKPPRHLATAWIANRQPQEAQQKQQPHMLLQLIGHSV